MRDGTLPTSLLLLMSRFFCFKFWLGTKTNVGFLVLFYKLTSNKVLWLVHSPRLQQQHPPAACLRFDFTARVGKKGGEKPASSCAHDSVLLELCSFYCHIIVD